MSLQADTALLEAVRQLALPEPLGFGRVKVPVMYRADWCDGKWGAGQLMPYAPLTLDPAAKVLHYGPAVFEGMKAYLTGDGSQINLFRPLVNHDRFNRSAARLCMPTISDAQFMEGLEAIAGISEPIIPSGGGQALYLRPFMIGTEDDLTIEPSHTYSFLVIAAPVGKYASDISLYLERNDCRAAPGGTGNVKVAGNYAAALAAAGRAQAAGCNQTLWLDAATHSLVEELSGMNFFAVVDGVLCTPPLTDSILPGVTRDSILHLAADLDIRAREVPIAIDELLAAIEQGRCTEAFACGTATIVAPVRSMLDGERRYKLPEGEVWGRIQDLLLAVQEGRKPGPEGWVRPVAEPHLYHRGQ